MSEREDWDEVESQLLDAGGGKYAELSRQAFARLRKKFEGNGSLTLPEAAPQPSRIDRIVRRLHECIAGLEFTEKESRYITERFRLELATRTRLPEAPSVKPKAEPEEDLTPENPTP